MLRAFRSLRSQSLAQLVTQLARFNILAQILSIHDQHSSLNISLYRFIIHRKANKNNKKKKNKGLFSLLYLTFLNSMLRTDKPGSASEDRASFNPGAKLNNCVNHTDKY